MREDHICFRHNRPDVKAKILSRKSTVGGNSCGGTFCSRGSCIGGQRRDHSCRTRWCPRTTPACVESPCRRLTRQDRQHGYDILGKIHKWNNNWEPNSSDQRTKLNNSAVVVVVVGRCLKELISWFPVLCRTWWNKRAFRRGVYLNSFYSSSGFDRSIAIFNFQERNDVSCVVWWVMGVRAMKEHHVAMTIEIPIHYYCAFILSSSLIGIYVQTMSAMLALGSDFRYIQYIWCISLYTTKDIYNRRWRNLRTAHENCCIFFLRFSVSDVNPLRFYVLRFTSSKLINDANSKTKKVKWPYFNALLVSCDERIPRSINKTTTTFLLHHFLRKTVAANHSVEYYCYNLTLLQTLNGY